MLKREKKKVKSKANKKIIEEKIYKTEDTLIKTRRKLKSEKEKKAIEATDKNPKMFYSITNEKNRKNELGPLKENDILIYKGDEMSEIFRRQYRSQFSENTSEKIPAHLIW